MKNTDNTYIIEIRNVQTIDGVKDVISERHSGGYYERGEKKYIMYKVSDGEAVTASTIIISDGAVTIKRSGASRSVMRLDARGKTVSPYSTPYGAFMIEAETDLIISTLDQSGGELRLKYTLTIQGEKYYNDMTIKVIGERK